MKLNDDHKLWEEAMRTKIDQHLKLNTWELTDLPESCHLIGCQWVYASKTHIDRCSDKAKAHLITQGFTQWPRMDYFEITSPVAKFYSLRIILAIVYQFDLEIHRIDVKGSYLNAQSDKEVYVKQPPGFDNGSGQVLHLNLKLY